MTQKKAAPLFRHVTFRLDEALVDQLDSFTEAESARLGFRVNRTMGLSAILSRFFEEQPAKPQESQEPAIKIGTSGDWGKDAG